MTLPVYWVRFQSAGAYRIASITPNAMDEKMNDSATTPPHTRGNVISLRRTVKLKRRDTANAATKSEKRVTILLPFVFELFTEYRSYYEVSRRLELVKLHSERVAPNQWGYTFYVYPVLKRNDESCAGSI